MGGTTLENVQQNRRQWTGIEEKRYPVVSKESLHVVTNNLLRAGTPL